VTDDCAAAEDEGEVSADLDVRGDEHRALPGDRASAKEWQGIAERIDS
jgi:hypothetical protein